MSTNKENPSPMIRALVRAAVRLERESCAKLAEEATPRHTECGMRIARLIRKRNEADDE